MSYLTGFIIFVATEAEEDDTPKPDFKPPPVVPREENRTGPNKKVYFVCNDRKYLSDPDIVVFKG